VLPSCFLKPGKKSDKHAASTDGIIARDSIFMDRIGDGDVARIKFTTRSNAICEMAYFAQQAGVEPTKDAPKTVPCSSQDKGQTDFTEELPGLRTDTLYFVQIKAWDPGGSKDHADSVMVKEAANPSSISTNGSTDGLIHGLFVARFDIPLRVAEVHHNVLKTPLSIDDVKAQLTRQTGCRQGVPDSTAPFRDADKDIALKNLATRDFAAGTAGPHLDYPERLQISYGGLNDGVDKWTLMYQLNGTDASVPIAPIGRIQNMDMTSTDTKAFDAPQLADPVDSLKIDPTKPLKFGWTTNGKLLDLSYMTVQIGRPDYDKSIYCVFPANAGSATVDPKLLQALDAGKHVVLAELTTTELWVKDGWLSTVYDWRSGRIEK